MAITKKTMKLLFQGEVSDQGAFKIFNRKKFIKEMELFAGKHVLITVEKKRKKRSLEQNAYYWGVIVMLVRAGLIDTGYKVSIEETHTFLKSKFLVKEIVNEQTGEILSSVKSTTELTTTGFMEYIQDIQQFAIEFLGVNVPDPNEQLEIAI